MTVQEAKKELEICNELMLVDFSYGEEIPYESLNESNKKLYDAHVIAIESMEKQIPKKPLADSLGERGMGFLIPLCPRCQRSIERTEALDVHCKYCGQKLDWSEEE